jgi:hypothetical protein
MNEYICVLRVNRLLLLPLQVKVVGPEGEQTMIDVTIREVSMERYSIRSKCVHLHGTLFRRTEPHRPCCSPAAECRHDALLHACLPCCIWCN